LVGPPGPPRGYPDPGWVGAGRTPSSSLTGKPASAARAWLRAPADGERVVRAPVPVLAVEAVNDAALKAPRTPRTALFPQREGHLNSKVRFF